MINRLPSTKELQAFLITAQYLNFTAAAQVLNVTQGAVSRQVISLEEQLKVRLFHRHARGLTLTNKGSEFLPLVEQAMNQIHRAVDQVSNDKQLVKLKAPSCITPWLLPKLMTFQQAYPDIDVELTSAIKHSVNFSTEPFDAAICYGQSPQEKSLLTNLLFEEYLTPVCSAALLPADKMTLSTDEMNDFTWLHATPQKSDWALWLKQANNSHLTADQNQHFATLDLSVSAAMQGFGIAIGDITLAKLDLESGRLVAPHTLTVASGNSYYLVRPKTMQNPSLELLIEWLI
jgi:LysR family transcriptional regulator, glycine cleavage system transcriptional activator